MTLIDDIKSLKIQGATNIALSSLKYLKRYGKQKGFGKLFDKKLTEFENTRNTEVLLYNAIQEIKKSKNSNVIDDLIKKISSANLLIAESGKDLIKTGYVVHTHCHSSTAIAVLKMAAKKKHFTVVVDETRPKRQGLITAKELSKIKNISVIFITDDAAGVALSPFLEPNDDIVIVGTDAIRKEGIVNKIGTYLLAVAASEQNIPFYVAGSLLKYDRRKKITIEQRPKDEVYRNMKNVKVFNPAFDITPWKYITGLITEDGIKTPREVLMELKSNEN